MDQDLKGKTALITGAGKATGIGYAIAKKLAQNGTHVILADLTKPVNHNPLISGSKAELLKLAQDLAQEHAVRTLAVSLDVTSSDSVRSI